MRGWDAAVAAEPGPDPWGELCRLAESATGAQLTSAADRLRAWPGLLRPMPDRWWAQRQAGDHRPWHALAAWRRLAAFGDYFYPSVVAGPDNLGVLLVGEGATGNNDLGQVLLLGPTDHGTGTGEVPDDPLDRAVVARLAEQVTAVDGLFGPGYVAVGFADLGGYDQVGPTVYGEDGRERYRVGVGSGESSDGMDCTRLGRSTDGRLIAASVPDAQAAVVFDAATGAVLLRTGEVVGPVALDPTGELLASAGPLGTVTVHEVTTGMALSTWDSGLAAVNALAFAPDARGLLAAGGNEPTACLLDLACGRVTGAVRVRAADPSLAVDALSPFAGFAARASWTRYGPRVFVADDERAVLFDGADGRIRWTSDAGQVVGSFTPDGRTLLASGTGGTIDAWFIDSLGPPDKRS